MLELDILASQTGENCSHILSICKVNENVVVYRFGRLLLAIPLLRMILPSTVETFFFRETVGDLSVMNLLQDMFNSERLTSIIGDSLPTSSNFAPNKV